ncbi:PadR family transcriptional regulator [Alicyclobacillus fodiniaquatilis]|uniref:PadR family transcriptional regulator n=1 Tax=Alicyclobacillus fodiniaquatilis TaxID=1661150 RepID=A0ABW4JGA3_9BACL
MADKAELISSLVSELRRGVIVLVVLSQLHEPKYGYSLVQTLQEKGVPVDAGTLYPLLRRLEKQELLHSDWEVGGSKPRKYYVMNDLGKEVYHTLCAEWTSMMENMGKLLNGDMPTNSAPSNLIDFRKGEGE